MPVSVEEFKRAVSRLEEALSQPKNEFIRDSVIQRFEFCVELSWKTAKRLMGTSTSAPKGVVREMGQNGYISDVGFWLRAIDERNNAAHTYNEPLAERVYDFAVDFLPEVKMLLERFVQ
jgi:nucleotidyltransferase substrate binding protein (TIGR01987 family)